MKKEIVHIIPAKEWDKVRSNDFYRPDSLKTKGFIPCATIEQILNVEEFLMKERDNHKLIYIDPEKVKAQIVYEDILNTGVTFPHIYGALNLDAVKKVDDYTPSEGKDSSFFS